MDRRGFLKVASTFPKNLEKKEMTMVVRTPEDVAQDNKIAALQKQIADMQAMFVQNDLLNRTIALEQQLAARVQLLKVANWSPQNPDLVVLAGSDPAAGAAVVIVLSLAPVGETMMLQCNFNGDVGGVDFSHIVQSGDTINSVAEDLAQQINTNPTCQAANITAELTPGTSQFGVTHYADNPLEVSAQRHPECFAIQQGSSGMDAGPILALNRLPFGTDGKPFSPSPGSNIGQITAGSCRADNPGEASTEYVCIGFNIINNDPKNLNAEMAVYIAATDPATGQQTLTKMLSIQNTGVYVGPNSRLL